MRDDLFWITVMVVTVIGAVAAAYRAFVSKGGK